MVRIEVGASGSNSIGDAASDLRREKLVPMGVEASSTDVDSYRSVTVFPPLTSSFFKELLFDSAVGRNIVLVMLGLILYVLVSLPSTRQGIIDAGTDPDDTRQMYFRPRNLYALLTTKIRSAQESHAMSSLAVSAPAAVQDGPLEFLVFVAQVGPPGNAPSHPCPDTPTSPHTGRRSRAEGRRDHAGRGSRPFLLRVLLVCGGPV